MLSLSKVRMHVIQRNQNITRLEAEKKSSFTNLHANQTSITRIKLHGDTPSNMQWHQF